MPTVAPSDISHMRAIAYRQTGTDVEREAIRRICREDPVAFCRVGVWARRVKIAGPDGIERPVPPEEALQPFLPWPGQVRLIRRLVAAVEDGRDVALAKSRDLGASTVVCSLAVWGWLWHRWDALLCSRIEDTVDRAGDPDTLFAKLDLIVRYLPGDWLPCPRTHLMPGPQGRYRRHMILEHPRGNAITGEATTAHIGRGARKTFIAFDEAAAQDRLAAGWRSAADTTASRWAISTHLAGSYFSSALWPQAEATNDPEAVAITYADDPNKGAGAIEKVDRDGSLTGDAGRRYIWTPWLERERGRRDLQDMRENVLCLPTAAGRGFFPASAIERLRAGIRPCLRADMVDGGLVESPAGRWRIWRMPEEGTSLVAFIDPSYGTGSANGCVAVMDAERRDLMAMFVCPHTPPYDLAREIVAASRSWLRGRYDLLVGWEVNGPGASLHHDFDRLRHHRVYRQRTVGDAAEKRTTRVGWHSTRATKRTLFGDLSRGMADGTITVPDPETIAEIEHTIVYADGGIGPARLEVDATSTAREAHGDRVVSLAGAWMLCDEAAGTPKKDGPDGPAPDSMAAILGIDISGPGRARPVDPDGL